MALDLLLLAAGFALLVSGAHLFVEAAVGLADRLRISPLVVGLTVVALGTSLPELAVNLSAAYGGSTGLAVGNVLGSNIINIMVVLGLSALLRPLPTRASTLRLEMPMGVILPLLLWPMAWGFTAGTAEGLLGRWDGLFLLAGAGLYSGWMFFRRSVSPKVPTAPRGWTAIAFLFLGGAGLLAVGSKITVAGALSLARAAGLSEAVIGLTVVALGTSLPELATSAVAAWKGKADIAVGNILGSNIFNIFLVLGATALVHPILLGPSIRADIGMTALSALLLWAAVLPAREHRLGRVAGGLFLLLYAGYVFWLFQPGTH